MSPHSLTILLIILAAHEASAWLASEQPQLRLITIVGFALLWVCKRNFIVNPNTLAVVTWLTLFLISTVKVSRGTNTKSDALLTDVLILILWVALVPPLFVRL